MKKQYRLEVKCGMGSIVMETLDFLGVKYGIFCVDATKYTTIIFKIQLDDMELTILKLKLTGEYSIRCMV